MDRYQRVEKAREETPISKNEIRVTAQGRMRNYISYALTLLQETGSNEIVLKAMGRAINKTVMIVELIKRRIVGLHQVTKTESIDITDVWEPLEEGLLPLETTRHVSMISITLSKIELDISDPGYQQPIPAEEVRALTDFETDEPNQFVDSVPRGRGRRGGYRGGRGGYRGGRMNHDEIGQGYEGNYAEEGGRGGYRGRRGGFRGGRMNNDEIGQGFDGNYADEGGRGGYRGGRGGFRGGRMNNDEIGQGYDGNYADEGGRGGYGYNRRGGYRGGRGRGPYRGGRGGRGNYYQNNDHYAVRDDVRDDDGCEQDVLPPPRTERGGRGRGMGRGRGRGHLPPPTEI